MGKSMVSCRFSLKPIHWQIHFFPRKCKCLQDSSLWERGDRKDWPGLRQTAPMIVFKALLDLKFYNWIFCKSCVFLFWEVSLQCPLLNYFGNNWQHPAPCLTWKLILWPGLSSAPWARWPWTPEEETALHAQHRWWEHPKQRFLRQG